MATKLSTPVSRETTRTVGVRPIIMTIAPAGGTQNETLVAFRLKGKRTTYLTALSDLYRMAALWHGQKEYRARKEARKFGVPWRRAKLEFARSCQIPKPVRAEKRAERTES